MKWNERQSEAIVSRNSNLLVAAAAGSGKTAVLVERIIRLLRDEGRSLSEMLIVTFTQAAAAEMKEKIFKALSDEISKPGKSVSEQRRLRSELSGMSRARISTFHSFALDIIRNYYHEAGIRPGLSVCDDESSSIMKNEAMEELFEARFEADDADFISFLDGYCSSKSNDAAKEMILSAFTFLQSLPYPQKWLEELRSGSLFDPDEGFAYIHSLGKKVLSCAYSCALEAAEMLRPSCPRLCALADSDCEMISAVMSACEDCGPRELFANIASMKWASLRAGKAEKAAYDDIKEDVKLIREHAKSLIKKFMADWSGVDPELLRREHEALSGPVGVLCALTEDFSARYAAKKDEKGMLDFSDLEHFSLRILENPEVCREYRDSIAYIFIDEYQDSNLVQEELIRRIAREDNVFMVGDIKQSIYKFRLAEPEIFLGKYERFKSGADEHSKVIDLNSNYRSKASVIEFVNRLFSRVMDRASCGIEYDEDAALVKGDAYEGLISYPARLYIVDSKVKDDDAPAAGAGEAEEDGQNGAEGAESPELDDEIEELKEDELEAAAALRIIREYHGKPIYDSKKGCERPLRYGDMVILMSAVKNRGEVFYKILSDAGLAVFIERGEGYFDTVEIQIFMSLLRLIDNSRRDVPLLSVLRSPLFGFSAAELAEVRIYSDSLGQRRLPYNDAFALYSKEGPDEALRTRCADFIEKLAGWRKKARYMPLGDLLWELLYSTGLINYAAALAGGRQRAANLRALVDKARQFEASDSGGLFGFISYIDLLSSRGTRIDTGQVKIFAEGSDSVRIMTIHKSKGLEFPFVLVAGMGKQLFSQKQGSGAVSFSRSLGIGMRIADPKNHIYNVPFLDRIIRQSRRDEEYAEKIRLLYVAATRPKDILLFSACVKNVDRVLRKSSLIPGSGFMRFGTYLDMILPSMKSGETVILDRGSLSMAEAKKQDAAFAEKLEKGFGSGLSDEAKLEIKERLESEYSGLAEGYEKRKYSVSQLAELERLGLAEGPRALAGEGSEEEAEERPFERPARVPDFMAGARRLGAAEIGTAYHRVMEHIPFEERFADAEQTAAFIESLREKRILSGEEASAIDPGRIASFFSSDIGRRAIASGEVFREAPFVMKHEYGGREILVQGTIDCYFEEDGRFILVDYKSNYVDSERVEETKERLRATYLPQLALYREALEKIRGKEVGEAVLFLFAIGQEIRIDQ